MRVAITVLFTLFLAVIVSASGHGTQPTSGGKKPRLVLKSSSTGESKQKEATEAGQKPKEVVNTNPTNPWNLSPSNAKSHGNQTPLKIGNDASSSKAAKKKEAKKKTVQDVSNAEKDFPAGTYIRVRPSAWGEPNPKNDLDHPGYVVGHQDPLVKVRHFSHHLPTKGKSVKDVLPARLLPDLAQKGSSVYMGPARLADPRDTHGMWRSDPYLDMSEEEVKAFENLCKRDGSCRKGSHKKVKRHVHRR